MVAGGNRGGGGDVIMMKVWDVLCDFATFRTPFATPQTPLPAPRPVTFSEVGLHDLCAADHPHRTLALKTVGVHTRPILSCVTWCAFGVVFLMCF